MLKQNSLPLGWRLATVGLAALLFCVSGCDHNRGAEVEGVVRIDGEPLPGGKITFYHPSMPGRNVTANIQSDGSYRVLFTPRGKVKVTVVAFPAKGRNKINTTIGKQSLAIPLKYTDPDTTDLVVEVGTGREQIDIDLAS